METQQLSEYIFSLLMIFVPTVLICCIGISVLVFEKSQNLGATILLVAEVASILVLIFIYREHLSDIYDFTAAATMVALALSLYFDWKFSRAI